MSGIPHDADGLTVVSNNVILPAPGYMSIRTGLQFVRYCHIGETPTYSFDTQIWKLSCKKFPCCLTAFVFGNGGDGLEREVQEETPVEIGANAVLVMGELDEIACSFIYRHVFSWEKCVKGTPSPMQLLE